MHCDAECSSSFSCGTVKHPVNVVVFLTERVNVEKSGLERARQAVADERIKAFLITNFSRNRIFRMNAYNWTVKFTKYLELIFDAKLSFRKQQYLMLLG